MTFHQNMKTTTPENRINAKLRLLALTSASTLNGGLEGTVVRSLATLGGWIFASSGDQAFMHHMCCEVHFRNVKTRSITWVKVSLKLDC